MPYINDNSLDFQPNGHRMATAGGGNNSCLICHNLCNDSSYNISVDSTVRLWNFTKVVQVESEDQTDHLLATLTSHTASVNIVRWSTNGTYLGNIIFQ
jgi:WD40 repeat protein